MSIANINIPTISDLARQLVILKTLCTGLRRHDYPSFAHSERVARGAMIIARYMAHEDPALLYLAGLGHDIGKESIRRRILRKPGPLTDRQMAHMRTHVERGETILSSISCFHPALLRGCREHHERLDGSGYPRGLAGADLSLEGKILAVADTYDSMASPRWYKASKPADVIDQTFAAGSGILFDPEVVEAFFACRRELEVDGFIDRLQVA